MAANEILQTLIDIDFTKYSSSEDREEVAGHAGELVKNLMEQLE